MSISQPMKWTSLKWCQKNERGFTSIILPSIFPNCQGNCWRFQLSRINREAASKGIPPSPCGADKRHNGGCQLDSSGFLNFQTNSGLISFIDLESTRFYGAPSVKVASALAPGEVEGLERHSVSNVDGYEVLGPLSGLIRWASAAILGTNSPTRLA